MPKAVQNMPEVSKEMIRCRSEVEEAVRMISSTYSRANNVEFGGREQYPEFLSMRAIYSVTQSLVYLLRISKGMERRLGDRGGGGNMDVIVNGGGGEDIKHDTSVECFVYYKTQGHVTTWFELQCHRGDQGVDAKGNDYWFEGYRCEMKGEKLLQYPYTIDDHEKP
ncbi:hypothetical protein Tco_0913027 [Tanacetum coccineum]